jgi:hypothetical protein
MFMDTKVDLKLFHKKCIPPRLAENLDSCSWSYVMPTLKSTQKSQIRSEHFLSDLAINRVR